MNTQLKASRILQTKESNMFAFSRKPVTAVVMLVITLLLLACGFGTNLGQPTASALTVAPPPANQPAPTASATLVRTLSHTPPGVMLSDTAFSPDGKLLASAGGTDYLVKLWDVASGQELRTLSGHTYPVSSVAFSPDGTILASGSWDTTVKLWDVTTGTELRTLSGHTDGVNGVAFSPDGKTLASASSDHTLALWDVATGTRLQSTAANAEQYAVAFAPDGKTVATATTGTGGPSVILWDAATWQTHLPLAGPENERVSKVAFSLDGQTLAAIAGWTVVLWNPATGQVVRSFNPERGVSSGLAYSPNGHTLAVGAGHAVVLLDPATGQQGTVLEDPGAQGDAVSLAFSPDGNLLAAVLGDKILLWNIATGQ